MKRGHALWNPQNETTASGWGPLGTKRAAESGRDSLRDGQAEAGAGDA